MTLAEAMDECQRWFAYLKRQREKSVAMQRIAAAQRSGEIDASEARRRVRALDSGVTVYDGAKLEQAVSVLLNRIAKNG